MASKYWIKLYHDILHDPKMGKLSDREFRRSIELFLLAGETDEGGTLPSIVDIAWQLRVDEEQLETEMIELQKVGILSVQDGCWSVTNFAKRQAAETSTERWQRWNERQHQQKYNGDETTVKRNSNETFAEEDIDIDKIRGEEDKSAASASALHEFNSNSSLGKADVILCNVSKLAFLPPDIASRKEQVYQLLETYGEDDTVKALEAAMKKWKQGRTKDNRPYRVLNPGWIDWAVEYLATGSLGDAAMPKTALERVMEELNG